MTWTAICTGFLFGVLSLANLLRVREEVEMYGSDEMLHNEQAYSPTYHQVGHLLSAEGEDDEESG